VVKWYLLNVFKICENAVQKNSIFKNSISNTPECDGRFFIRNHLRNADLIKPEPDRFSKPVRFDKSSFGFIKS